MTRQLLRMLWLIVGVAALPGWVFSFYIIPLNLMAVVLLFALGVAGSKGRALDAFMATVVAGMAALASLFAVFTNVGLTGVVVASMILSAALLVAKCGALYAQVLERRARNVVTRSARGSMLDRHAQARDGGNADVWLTTMVGVVAMLVVFIGVTTAFLLIARQLNG